MTETTFNSPKCLSACSASHSRAQSCQPRIRGSCNRAYWTRSSRMVNTFSYKSAGPPIVKYDRVIYFHRHQLAHCSHSESAKTKLGYACHTHMQFIELNSLESSPTIKPAEVETCSFSCLCETSCGIAEG